MKKWLLGILGIACCVTLFAARGKTTPPGWFDDYEKAREKARNENKRLMLLFTGSDWCGFCIKLRKTVLDKPSFKSFAKKNLVLVFIDGPKRTKLPEALRRQNSQLVKKFPEGGYGVPKTVIITPDEKVVGVINGCPNDPKDYRKRLQGLVYKQPQSVRSDFPGNPVYKGPCDRIVYPRVLFAGADAMDVFKFLEKHSSTYDPQKDGVLIGCNIPSDHPYPVTLDMKNAPLGEVIKQVCSQTGLGFRVDGRTIIIFEKTPSKGTP